MISGKDVRVEGNKLFINGEAYDIVRDTSAIEDAIEDLGEEIGDLSQTGLTGDSVAGQLTTAKGQINGKLEIENNAGFHNSIYRGKSLGTEVTAAQFAAIEAGTFDDMYIGDYWTIGNVNYRIAHFDYWLGTGDTECTTHHVVVVPDTNLYNAKMNDSNVTTGAYYNSKMRGGTYYLVSGSSNLYDAKVAIDNAFGSVHILSHRELLTNATSDGNVSAWAWYDSTVDLMSEVMVYGALAWSLGGKGQEVGIDKVQLALFRLNQRHICNREFWWLRGVNSDTAFVNAGNRGNVNYDAANTTIGVRPVFAIIAETNREIEETNREIEEVKTAKTKKK